MTPRTPRVPVPKRLWAAVGLIALLAGALLWLRFTGAWSGGPSRAAPRYVGMSACIRCHEAQGKAWVGSHHDRAMEEATSGTVLGDFDGATFTLGGVTSTFFTRDGKYFVRTDGPDGALHEYQIPYTFGVTPLQQYLVSFPGGRLQALGIAWDTRPRESGGQRWFHLYPDRPPQPGDPLHWTGIDQTWNYQCAECHSTDLRKNYDPATRTYRTTWSEIDVSCEACHGPGSAHVAWADAGARHPEGSQGLTVRFRDRIGATWEHSDTTGIAKRVGPPVRRTEVEACAFCHSRRGVLREGHVPGRTIHDTHRVSLLEEGLYDVEGQIRAEVYEYGSFRQSRMYRAGVTCSDCHDPHSLAIRAPGNALCARCHSPAKYDQPTHHFHEAGSPAAECKACHMAQRVYMVVDPRWDHSFRVPRPDLSVSLGAPNACNDCHTKKSDRWAADAVERWYGRRDRPLHYGEVLSALRAGLPGSVARAESLAGDTTAPAIVRATVLSEIRLPGEPASRNLLGSATRDPDPQVRLAAAGAAEGLDLGSRRVLLAPLLADSVRGVRITAARALAGAPAEGLSSRQRVAYDRALGEYRAAQAVNADRPEAHLNLGLLEAELGRTEEAKGHYREALRIDPRFTPAYANLADLYRATGQNDEAMKVLREGLALAPEDAALHHSLGLALVRSGNQTQALEELRRAHEEAPANPRFSYVYAVALNAQGDSERALEVLDRAHLQRPGDREILTAAATISRDAGRTGAAIRYAEALVALAPGDPAARELLSSLRGESQSTSSSPSPPSGR